VPQPTRIFLHRFLHETGLWVPEIAGNSEGFVSSLAPCSAMWVESGSKAKFVCVRFCVSVKFCFFDSARRRRLPSLGSQQKRSCLPNERRHRPEKRFDGAANQEERLGLKNRETGRSKKVTD